MGERYTFGGFELDVGAFSLTREGRVVAVQPEALDLPTERCRGGPRYRPYRSGTGA